MIYYKNSVYMCLISNEVNSLTLQMTGDMEPYDSKIPDR